MSESSQEWGWYVVKVQSGKEESVQKSLWNKIKSDNNKDVQDFIIPKYKEIVYKDGRKKILEKKSFPGYLYLKIKLTKELMKYILDVPYASTFVTFSNDKMPSALPENEVQNLLKMSSHDNDSSISNVEINLKIGEKVLIIDGPFNNFSGLIKAIYPDKKKVCVNVEIFGRTTPVEIDYFKVKKN